MQPRKQPSPGRLTAVIRMNGRAYTVAEAGAMAMREHQLKNFPAALCLYNLILANLPNSAETHNNRGAVLQNLKRPDEALASYDRAIALKPDYANAHYNRGSLLKSLNRHDDALASFDRAIALNPNHADAINSQGLVLMNKGNMAEAEKMLLKAIALKPNFPAPLFNLVSMRKYQSVDNADEKTIQSLLKQPGLSVEGQEQLYYSLGKIYDDCNHYEAAFNYYRLANQIRNTTVAYDADWVTRLTNTIVEVFTKDFLGRPPAFGSNSASPLFIVGMPRSGTTLLANILSNHPAIATAGELPTLPDTTSRLAELTRSQDLYPAAARHLTPDVAARLIKEYEQRLRRDCGTDVPHVIDKNPLNFRHLGFIAMLFPRARIIHCTRHPLATGLSNYFQRFPVYFDYSFDLRNIGHFQAEYLRLMEHWRTALPLKLIEISYEDMVVNTEQTARQTLNFLGLEWDERCLAPHTNPCAVETASVWQVRQPIYQEALERWRHYETHLAPLKKGLLLAGQRPTTPQALACSI